MRSNWQGLLPAALLSAASLLAQEAPLPSGSVSINLSKDAPVALKSWTSDQSSVTARGAAMVLDLHVSLTLQNIGPNRIHGVMLRVVAQEVTLGGRGSVTYPSLNIGPGEVFPVRIDMQLVRPTQFAGGPLVQVDLDGVLYQDLSFYGPDRLHSRRFLTARELEAQRDREHFKRVMAQGGRKALQDEILGSMARQAEIAKSSPLNVKVVRSAGAVTSAAMPAQQTTQFAFLQFPDAPVAPVEGYAQVSANEARMPRIEVVNKSNRPVKYVELGWVLSDASGRQSAAAALPSADPDLYLPPGKTARVLSDSALKLYGGNNQPVNVQKMTGFISQVEFADGKMWVPDRENLNDPMLTKVLAPSAEEQRLATIYSKRGLDGLIEELKKF
jgi:hypothetical protein